MTMLLCGSCEAKITPRTDVDLIVDLEGGLVMLKGKLISLSNGQQLLLESFVRARGGVVPLKALIEASGTCDSSALRTAIHRLREIIGIDAIECLPKLGYRIVCSFARGKLT